MQKNAAARCQAVLKLYGSAIPQRYLGGKFENLISRILPENLAGLNPPYWITRILGVKYFTFFKFQELCTYIWDV
jgi:hypothetical protein